MSVDSGLNEELIRRLPLPLAKLYRHAANAKSALDRHQAAFFLWEAALKLLAITEIVAYADRAEHDPKIAEQLKSLARPSLGEWRKYVRLLLPVLAAEQEEFRKIKALLEQSRDDLPRAAGLDAVLRETLESKSGARSTVRLDELFDRLVTYRNQELGHGAAGLRTPAFYDRMGRALLAGVGEILQRLDVFAGRRLIYVAEVSRAPSGNWLIERFELIGEMSRRLDPLELPSAADADGIIPGRVYLESSATTASEALAAGAAVRRTSLHPLAMYDANAKELLLLNSQRNRKRCDYLCYSSGEVTQVDGLSGQMSGLLTRIFGEPVAADEVDQWAARSLAEDSAGPAESVAAGTRSIGEFELLSKLGQGGMGVVYRAWQPSVGRQVALKCLLRAGDPKSAERFAREYRALGRVDHPHLVKVFTSGAEGDQWFYAMELIEGATLAAVCERLQEATKMAVDVAPDTWRKAVSTTCEEARRSERPLSSAADRSALMDAAPAEIEAVPPIAVESYVRHVVELVRQTATAAQKLHETGVVHRDIKPGNIMLTVDGAQAVLMDLGLAQWIDKEKITSTRQFVGTLRYASPEQVLAVGRLDGRSDVYSLGVTLWELLTLRPMFGATDDTPTPELMKRIQFADAELIGKYHSGIAADLQAIITKCLEKNPEHRYKSAEALADDLGRWLRNEPVLAQPMNWRYRTGKFIRRHRRAIAVGAAVVLLQAILVASIYHASKSSSGGAKGGTVAAGSGDSDGGNGVTASREGGSKKLGDLTNSAVRATPGPVTTPTPKCRALLIGCGYPTSSASATLGPANDVALFQSVLTSHFGLAPADVRILTSVNGTDPKSLPTRANIQNEMETLAGELSPGDQAIIVLGGASSLAAVEPALGLMKNDSDGDVYDNALQTLFWPADAVVEPLKPTDANPAPIANPHVGLDETNDFSPRKSSKPFRQTVQNAISGDDVAKWLSPMIEKHASVWLICDMSNGGFARQLADRARNAPSEPGAVVLLYACQQGEVTFQQPLPQGSDFAVAQGLFSYSICESLARSSRPLNSIELINQIRRRHLYRERTSGPTPWCIGRGIDSSILGGAGPVYATFRIKSAHNDQYSLSAGSLLGLTKGCILEVMTGDDNHARLGQLRVVGGNDYEATAVPIEFGSVMPVGALAKLAYVDFGDLRLKVAVCDQTRGGEKVPQEMADRLEAVLDREARKQGSVIQAVGPAEHPDWDILLGDAKSDSVFLAPATSVQARGNEPEDSVGPFPIASASSQLQPRMAAIARANNLLTLAQISETESQRGQPNSGVKLEMLRLSGPQDTAAAVLPADESPELTARDWVSWRLTNESDSPMDVTLLYINSKMEFIPVFPGLESDADNRLAPRASLLADKARITATTQGTEHVVLIWTRAGDEAYDFSFLAMDSLEPALSTPEGVATVRHALDTPLGKLLENAFYGKGQQRSMSVGDINRFPVRSLSWRVVPSAGEKASAAAGH